MLLSFSVTNFLSFKERTTFDMFASARYTDTPRVQTPVRGLETVRMAAIYGANGAGKSNLIKAISFLQDAVKNRKLSEELYAKPFKFDTHLPSQKSQFEIIVLLGEVVYEYHLHTLGNTVMYEYLKSIHIDETETILLERDLIKGVNQPKIDVKEYELAISITNGEGIVDFVNWLKDSLLIIFTHSKLVNLSAFLGNKENRMQAGDMLRLFSTGINQIETEEQKLEYYFGDNEKDLVAYFRNSLEANPTKQYSVSNNLESLIVKFNEKKEAVVTYPKTVHEINGEPYQLHIREESDGTRRILELITLLLDSNGKSHCIIIDEIESSLHTHIAEKLVDLLRQHITDGQVVFTTHNTHLLRKDLLHKDEVWFANKNESSSTELYPLSSFENLEEFDNWAQAYEEGRFGATPNRHRLNQIAPATQTPAV